MIIVIICAIIGIVLAILLLEPYDFGDWFLAGIMAVLFGAVGALVGAAIAYALPADTKEHREIQVLVTLQDGSQTTGSFFLGTGSIDGSMYYAYYSEVTKGGYALQQIRADRAIISYTDQRPRIEIVTQQPTDSWINWFAYDETKENYIFYVPENSILNQYNLDAQ